MNSEGQNSNYDTVSRGEGKPFIPPAELGGIPAYFDKCQSFLTGRFEKHRSSN
jgi:hypothetical protein